MNRPDASTQDEVRRFNLASLLRLLHVRGATSRADLTSLTGLNRSTVKALTQDLVEVGLVHESAPVGRGGAGRPSITVEPESDRVFVLALDIGVEHLTAIRVGLGEMSAALVTDVRPDAVCVGIGIAVCGVVSSDDGLVRFAPNLGWVDVPLRSLVAEALATSLPIEIGNDGDLGARAEHLRGVGVGVSDLVYLSGEVGIGGGFILGGRPMRGSGGYGGEIGHMSVDPRGHLCRCGRRGCWETEVGDEAVLLAVGAEAGAQLSDVLAAYAAGERWVQAGMRRVGRSLGQGVVNLVNIFNPELIVFGGASSQIFTATEPMVREALMNALTAPQEQVRLALPGLGDDSIAVGAAELAFARLLADPLGTLAGLPPVMAHA